MAGWNWTGEFMDWKQAPQQWGAIHFHDDDIYDALWETDFSLKIPDDMPSGLYAARLRAPGSEEYIPSPSAPRPARSRRLRSCCRPPAAWRTATITSTRTAAMPSS